MKSRNKNTLKFIAAASLFVIVLLVILVVSAKNHHKREVLSNQQSDDQVSSFTRQLSGKQAQTLSESFTKKLHEQSLKDEANTQEAVSHAVDQALKKFKAEQAAHKHPVEPNTLATLKHVVKEQMEPLVDRMNLLKGKLHSAQSTHYQLNGASHVGSSGNDTSDGYVWYGDIANDDNDKTKLTSSSINPLGDNFSVFDKGDSATGTVKKSSSDQSVGGSTKPKPVPFYTIPANSVMTGVIPLQPLIGQIPKGDSHRVFEPFSVMFVTEHPTLMAQGHEAPMPVAKMTGTAICLGYFVAHAVTCRVQSLTFIFNDGHFNTITPEQNNQGNSQSNAYFGNNLGILADNHGNPQIVGQLETSLGLRLAMRGATAGIGAYGQGISQAQVQNYGSSAVNTLQSIKNANQYATGQAISGAASGAQDEITKMEKNMFDYVFVPNWNPKTQRLIRLNIIVHRELDIDYDKTGRKIDYANTIDNHDNNILF